MANDVRTHYELYPYPRYPLLASVRRCDTYALNLTAVWTRFNGALPPPEAQRILIAGCGSFSPYPFALANPDAAITALDLSERSLRRARLHCLLHGRTNVTYRQGDLLDAPLTGGPFGLIDAYGVLHHLDDPLAGLTALAGRLAPGGVVRLMVYSRYARREEEAIRRAFRLVGITDPAAARRLMARAKPGSRLRRFAETSDEASFDSGLADALLHPRVRTFRVAGLLDLVRQSGLEPLLFAHHGAREDVGEEVERLTALEAARRSPGNFILYAGRNVAGPCPVDRGSLVMLNPCLSRAVTPFALGTVHIAPRLGIANPVLTGPERALLRGLRHPRPWDDLSPACRALLPACRTALFLLQFRG
ncbi:class I SAM-dependent methyltransferase [Geobacter sp. FeAm09]|uniref:class I SAM-dependent methyltransferase n=1 Tax=Geobacter sp. FeAm09 TaxID=2597769 RepID=UPI0011EF9E60|nr:class I SAM-dependent methyltransferase [Geobacter sp. FeAm09]QEM67764.1 class I SAM-dependent methyltransferase [Geobacter sp. FeAm09]